jgi:hypothetical protein
MKYTNVTNGFLMLQGQRQGDVLSTLIFIVVLDPSLQLNGTVFNKQPQIFGYNNDIGDINIIGRSKAAFWEVILALEREAKKVCGLKINESKTRYLI